MKKYKFLSQYWFYSKPWFYKFIIHFMNIGYKFLNPIANMAWYLETEWGHKRNDLEN